MNCSIVGWSGTDAGGKMKITGTIQAGTGLWNSPKTGTTNECGFSAVPAGGRYPVGPFWDICVFGNWWGSTDGSTSDPWKRTISYNGGGVDRVDNIKVVGLSVRCLRDY